MKEALLALEFAGRAPREVVLIGVVPGRIEMAVTLTPPVQAALPEVVSALVATLERFGIAVSHRAAPLAPAAWWTPTVVIP